MAYYQSVSQGDPLVNKPMGLMGWHRNRIFPVFAPHKLGFHYIVVFINYFMFGFLASCALTELWHKQFIPVLWWMILCIVMFCLHVIVDLPSMLTRISSDRMQHRTRLAHHHTTVVHWALGFFSKFFFMVFTIVFYVSHNKSSINAFNDARYRGGTIAAARLDMHLQWTPFMAMLVFVFILSGVTSGLSYMSLRLPKQLTGIATEMYNKIAGE